MSTCRNIFVIVKFVLYGICTGKIVRLYPSSFLVSSPVAFGFLGVLVLNIAEKLLAGR